MPLRPMLGCILALVAFALPMAHAQDKLPPLLSSPPDAAQSPSQGRPAAAVSAASGTALTLRSLLASASANNPTLAAVRLESRATAQQITSAERQRWPTISVAAETNTGSLTSTPSRFLRVQQTLWDAGRKSARIDEAKTQSDIGLTNIYLQQQDLFIQIVNAWQSLIGASERIKVAEDALKRLLGYQAQMTRRVDAQASPTIDLELVNARLLQTQVELVTAKTSQQVALTQLEQLTVTTALAERAGLIELPPTVESTQPFANALPNIDWEFVASENPTVTKARFEVALARNRLDARRADKWPELYARVDQPIGRTLTTRDTKATGFIGFSYTPGAGFASLSEEQAQTTRIASQEQALAASVRTMEATLRNDREEFINARARIAALDKSVSGSALVLESYQRQFQAGRKTWQDLLNAVRELAQNQYAAAEAQAIMVGAMQRLEIRMGQSPHFP